MFKEILKIIPRLEVSDLNKMERSLTQRFTKIAKKFGKGLGSALAGGGIAGLALGLIDKFLNPLKETQEAIDRVLKQGDDIVTNAKQFNTTAGKLFKLTQVAKSTGLDEAGIFELIKRFQTSVAEAVADPTKQTSVRKFVGIEDTAEAFFQFIQGLQRMDKNQQLLAQQEVFGERQILKMADFLQTDFNRQLAILQARPAEQYTPSLERLGALNDLTDALEARRTLEDTIRKGNVINEGMVRSRDVQARLELERENQRIQSYKSLATISEASTRMLVVIEKGFLILSDLATKISGLSDIIKRISTSRLFKGMGLGE